MSTQGPFTLRSPSLTEGAFARVHSDHRELSGIADAIAVGRYAEARLRKVSEVWATVDADPTMPEPARRLAKLNYLERQAQEIAARGAKAWTALERAEADLQVEVRESIRVPLGVNGEELRSGLFRLKPDDRMKVLSAALQAGPRDPQQRAIFGAAIGSPAFLSGLSDAQQTMLRERWIQEHAPELVERRAAITEAQEKLDTLRRALERKVAAAREHFGGELLKRSAETQAALAD